MDYAGRVSISSKFNGKHDVSDSQYVYELLCNYRTYPIVQCNLSYVVLIAEPFDGENGDDDNEIVIDVDAEKVIHRS